MKKMKFYFALALALLGIGSVANADELTVYDGTKTNDYVPVYHAGILQRVVRL